jgi:hypothetical protein
LAEGSSFTQTGTGCDHPLLGIGKGPNDFVLKCCIGRRNLEEKEVITTTLKSEISDLIPFSEISCKIRKHPNFIE